jgi:hypothetical protein
VIQALATVVGPTLLFKAGEPMANIDIIHLVNRLTSLFILYHAWLFDSDLEQEAAQLAGYVFCCRPRSLQLIHSPHRTDVTALRNVMTEKPKRKSRKTRNRTRRKRGTLAHSWLGAIKGGGS